MFDVSTVIYSLIYAAVSGMAIDRTHSQNINVEVRIITKKDNRALEQEILRELDRGITRLDSVGAYTNEKSNILYILISKYEVSRLKHIVLKYDPHAFIVMNEGVSVIGHYLKNCKKVSFPPTEKGIEEPAAPGGTFQATCLSEGGARNVPSRGGVLISYFSSFSFASVLGSQVRCIPSFLKMPSSTGERSTVECTSQPFNRGESCQGRGRLFRCSPR